MSEKYIRELLSNPAVRDCLINEYKKGSNEVIKLVKLDTSDYISDNEIIENIIKSLLGDEDNDNDKEEKLDEVKEKIKDTIKLLEKNGATVDYIDVFLILLVFY